MLPTFITTNQSQSSCREIGKGAGKEVVSGDGIDCKWLLANKSKLCSSAAYYADCAPAILYICMYIYILYLVDFPLDLDSTVTKLWHSRVAALKQQLSLAIYAVKGLGAWRIQLKSFCFVEFNSKIFYSFR